MTPHPPPFDWAWLDRYLAGTASSEEAHAVRGWLAEDPTHQAAVAAMRRAGMPAELVDRDWQAPVAWGVLSSRLRGFDALAPVLRAPSARPAPWPQGVGENTGRAWRVSVIAAVVVVIIGAVSFWRSGVRRSAGQQFREFTSALGGRATVTLRDGTHLVLGPGTRLRVPSDFGRAERRVDLDGEALFTVVHDERHPFAVHTARALVRDIGTTFVVRAYADDKTDRVVVQEGHVALSATATGARGRAAAAGTALGAGDVGTVGDTSVVVARHADVAPYIVWVQGGLSFDNTPLRDAVRDVARAFSLEITLADSSLGAKPITSTFGDEPADEVLDAITRVVGARYERSGRMVVIRRGPARSNGGNQGLRLPISTAQNGGPHE